MQGGGFSVTGQGSVTGSGVVIVNVPGGPSDTIGVSGQGVVSLSAPTGGVYQGVALVQLSGNPVGFSGQANVTIAGVVYVPNAPVSITGGAVVTIGPGPGTATLPPIAGALIAYDLKVGGNGVLAIDPDDPPSVAPAAAVGGGAAIQGAALEGLMAGGGVRSPAAFTDPQALGELAMGLVPDADPLGGPGPGPRKRLFRGT
jgi:hypothetical protein